MNIRNDSRVGSEQSAGHDSYNNWIIAEAGVIPMPA